MQTSDLNVNNIESDHATAIFRQFQDAIFSREHTSVKTSTKIIFDLLQRQEIATLSLPKKGAIANISRAFFSSEPMTLPEIDHVSFLQSTRRHFSPVKIIVNTYASSMRNRVTYRFQINSSYTCGRAKTIQVDAKCFENGEKSCVFKRIRIPVDRALR